MPGSSPPSPASPIQQVIVPRVASLGGASAPEGAMPMTVRRILPYRAKRQVGPFTFLDEMGPIEIAPHAPGAHHPNDVPPHPHIGLSTVTYLFEGEMLHRDSLGSSLAIRPGELNWMTAGRGIAHSERFPALSTAQRLHGLQAWVALPVAAEESEPTFEHYERDALPRFEIDGVRLHLIAGEAYGHRSPARTHSPLFYLSARFEAGQTLEWQPDTRHESALYLVSGEIETDGQVFGEAGLIVFRPGTRVSIRARATTLAMLLGGEPLPEPRHIYWNFVSSSPERIDRAKKDWAERRFPTIPGETEFIPLPDAT